MAILHRRPRPHGRVRGERTGAHLRDSRGGDVGFVPFAMGHYIENTGSAPLRFLEIFKSSYYADLSLNQGLALTPPELVKVHLELNQQFMDALRKAKSTIVPA
jgi:oxalate decarboxylase